MKTSDEVTPEKLRGGFYTPEPLVRICLDRVQALSPGSGRLRLLEPSAGDGAFVRLLGSHPLRDRVASVTAIELVSEEAAACAQALRASELAGETINASVLEWLNDAPREFDAAVGNPPFVRFQFVRPEDRTAAAEVHARAGVPMAGVSNLWIPILVGSLASLRAGGAYSFVLPTEVLTGVSGRVVRDWLLTHSEELHLDLFPPGSFPGVLQEVAIVSGRIADGPRPSSIVSFRERLPQGVLEWQHVGKVGEATWTRYLLTDAHLEALREVAELREVQALSDLARFEVATVTGANAFFCVDADDVVDYSLKTWARPLLPRTRHAPGLRFTQADHEAIAAQGEKAWLLDFSASRPSPESAPGAARYLAFGVSQGLPSRYKCRIRSPWHRVPVVAPGDLLMSKRSHLFPRMIVNEAAVVTTDTIYRGRMLANSPVTTASFAAGFHNSLTLLTAEIEGRSFGGGVLELVPSEIKRLLLPASDRFGGELDRLDWVSRTRGTLEDQALVDETDELAVKYIHGLSSSLMSTLREARECLLLRRLSRT
ncbi:DNA methyltransferase family protein [Cellulomonas rhizosphaerae]|uniref:Class I SAM-dependent methyltransferase n=1 Tax=Cellulomonas rhizosphaerae TaxID=2293719 RepID=A0A413RLQ8_9CELL|nr:class I SAM-dependent methyltransferase [Cellulomonas rhizosphaerae]RHA40991.1 class I SAM-dependent methyltransferase [Cellulomonas rhizosphaerae]